MFKRKFEKRSRKLSNWWLYFLHNDPDGLIPTGPGVTASYFSAVANVEPNSHFPRRNPTTVTLNVGRPVHIHVDALVYGCINGLGAFFAVESEVPSLAAVCAARYANDAHVHHTQVGISFQLGEVTMLEPNKETNKDHG